MTASLTPGMPATLSVGPDKPMVDMTSAANSLSSFGLSVSARLASVIFSLCRVRVLCLRLCLREELLLLRSLLLLRTLLLPAQRSRLLRCAAPEGDLRRLTLRPAGAGLAAVFPGPGGDAFE